MRLGIVPGDNPVIELFGILLGIGLRFPEVEDIAGLVIFNGQGCELAPPSKVRQPLVGVSAPVWQRQDTSASDFWEAAAGTSRTRVTAIANGNTRGVSTDVLIRVRAATGHRAEIRVKKTAA